MSAEQQFRIDCRQHSVDKRRSCNSKERKIRLEVTLEQRCETTEHGSDSSGRENSGRVAGTSSCRISTSSRSWKACPVKIADKSFTLPTPRTETRTRKPVTTLSRAHPRMSVCLTIGRRRASLHTCSLLIRWFCRNFSPPGTCRLQSRVHAFPPRSEPLPVLELSHSYTGKVKSGFSVEQMMRSG